jgi:SAM-dependent methyltransferase
MPIVSVLRSALKSQLPFQPTLRQWARRLRPYQDNPGNSHYAFDQGLQQITLLRAAGVDLRADILEFGSGWLPIIPLLYTLAGARRLILTDIERLMDDRTTARARHLVEGRLAEVAAALQTPEPDLRARLAEPFTPDYLVPWDAHRHPAASVDLVVSRAVFEHVPPPALRDFIAAFGRILRPGGTMCHTIDNSDHWEHLDKTRSRIEFLRHHDGPLWRLATLNPQDYQNRLRHSDYLALFDELGWSPLIADGTPDPKCLADLKTLPLAPAFAGRDPADLAILNSVLVLARSDAAPTPARQGTP